MRRFGHLVLAISLLGLAGAGNPPPPAIAPGGIVNAASRMPASLRGGALSPGVRFVIPGVRLGPEIPVHGSESEPPGQLSQVSVRISRGDRAVVAGLLLVSAARIDAVMPPAAPLGEVELTVTYGTGTSEPYKLTLVPDNAGLFSGDTAPDAIPEAKRKPDAAPGDTVTLWGTGMAARTPEIRVGDKPAAGILAGAACCSGVQQVTFRVPAESPLGCFVPVQAGNSNVIPISVHAPGAACRDDLDWFRESVEHAASAGFVALARVSIDMKIAPGAGSQFQFDYGVASFGRQESGQRPFPPLPPLHTCTVFTARLNLRQLLGQARTPSEWTSIPEKTRGNRRLDAGSAITLTGPSGTRTLALDPREHDYYAGLLGGLAPFSREEPKPLFLDRGSYSVSAPGGSEIAPFTTKADVPGTLLWKNRGRIDTVRRDSGVTVEWKAARSADAILILAANADRASGDSAVCLCLAPAADGRFAIPAHSLANLPPTPDEDDLTASYLVLMEMPVNPPARIQTRGLDTAFAAFVSASARLVQFR